MMQLVPFQHAHLTNFKANRFTKPGGDLLSASSPEVSKYTALSAENQPLAVICFKETEPSVYAAFFLVSEDFGAGHCAQLRDFVQVLVAQQNAKEVWTVSCQDPELAHWHEFLGLKRDGTVQIEDKTYDVWRMRWA